MSNKIQLQTNNITLGEYIERVNVAKNVAATLPKANDNTSFALQNKQVSPSESTQLITADSDYDGLSSVTIYPIPEHYIIPSGTLAIEKPGNHDVTEYANINVLMNLLGVMDIVKNGSYDVNNYSSVFVNVPVDIDTSDATAQASEILFGETAYVDGDKITGTFTIDNELNA